MDDYTIIKTKGVIPEKSERAWGCGAIMQELWGEPPVAEAFLYLYRRYGKPCEERAGSRLAYRYTFRYMKVCFVINATAEQVTLDCYYQKQYGIVMQERREEAIAGMFDIAAENGVLLFPDIPRGRQGVEESLLKRKMRKYVAMYNAEMKGFFDTETYQWLDSLPPEGLTDEQAARKRELVENFHRYLYTKFWKWAEDKEEVKRLFDERPSLKGQPELDTAVRGFCNSMLEKIKIGDRYLSIRGWQTP